MQLDLKTAAYSITHSVSHVASENYLIHSHPFYELYYFMRGDVRFLYAGTEYIMTPDTLVIVVPNVFHGVMAMSDQPYERITLHFLDELIVPQRRGILMGNLPTEQTIRERSNRIPYILPDAARLGIPPLLKEFDALRQLPAATQLAMVSVLVEGVLAKLLLHTGSAPSMDSMPPYHTGQRELDKVLTYIHQNLTRKLSLNDLSSRFFISKSKLNNLFRRQMGTTVMEYVTRRRVSYAQQLMMNGLSAMQAGAAAGFGDYTSFYRAYMKQTGRSPKNGKRELPDSADALGEFCLPDNSSAPYALRPEDRNTIWDSDHIIIASERDPGILRD